MALSINYRTSISLVLLITVALRAQNVLGCHDTDRKALLKFKQSFTFDPLNRLASWKGKYCCNWSGVRCDNITGRVNHLNISQYNEMYEYSIVSIQQRLLAQRLDPSLIELTQLNYLDLSGVDFQGAKLPGFIDSFQRLRYLNVSGSNFDALLPPQLSNLTKLRGLSLSGEDGSFLNWLPNLVNLEYLDMSGSEITRPRDFMGAISKLHSLRDLRLSSCRLGNTLFSANSTWLSKIRHLELSFNNIKSLSPRVFSSMTSLTYLDLSINLLSGSVPRWIRNMRTLEHLDLSSNSLREDGESIMMIAGNFKVFIFSYNSLQELLGPCWNLSNRGASQLEELYLFDCNIIGTLPHCLSDFRKLKILELGFNQISGQIPASIGNLSFLESLSLGDNSLSGRIPSSIGGLSSLQTLALSNNYLDGSIPTSLGQLNSLVYIRLSSNILEGVVSESHLRNLSSLRVLDMSNNSLSVKVNSEWRPPFQLTTLYMSSCKINGEFSNWIKSQRELNMIDLSNTGISGELPRWFWNMTLDVMILSHNHIEGTIGDFSYTLRTLDLSYNSISGSLRRSLCQLNELNHLDLQSNKLSGSIPDCWVRSTSQLLGTINLSSNKLTGLIPKSIGELVNLSFLSLNNNSLEGEIPQTFSTGRKLLQIIDLGENQVSGSVPGFSVKTHPYLKILRLRENKLTGGIPERLCSLPSVQVLDLASNNLTGNIPRCFANFNSMKLLPSPNTPSTNLVFPDSQSTTETVKSQELTYTKNLKYLVNLDLSCNGLHGSIPERIVDLSGLIGLNLSHNHLSGGIPKNIGEMKSLESLDLAYNHLSGTIPSGLASLTYLSSLNISNNQLDGQIPTGNQLRALNDASIYAGNPGLCGDPLPNKCGSTDDKQPPQQGYKSELDKKDNLETILFFFVIFLGFATGFWGVFGSVLLNRSFKFALFQLMNNTTDYFYLKIMVIIDRLTK